MIKRTQHLTLMATMLVLGVLGSLLAPALKASALSGSDFMAGHIVDDSIFSNSGTMGTTEIQNFLNAKVPVCDTNGTKMYNGSLTRAQYGASVGDPAPYTCLKDYSQNFSTQAADAYCGGIAGGTKSAANIIFDVSQACGINPEVIIVLLQKEQSLITDDWPFPIEYRSATGYGCPDSSVCDSDYYGFFNQVYNAAHQFKRYTAQPQNYNYAAGRISNILYNPVSSCGSSSVGIQSRATAALYNYTPYQPNQAALSNLNGPGDSCSSHGNLNFWINFNNWFGPTTTDGYTLAMNADDNSQWVIYRGIKQYVPSAEVKQAWGLPDVPVTMTGNYLATIPTGPALGRLFHLIGSSALYFADGGKKYYVPSAQLKTAWGLDGQVESYVSNGLWSLPKDAGTLTYAVKNAEQPNLYMIDGKNDSGQVVLRQYSSPDVFHAWEGDNAGWTTVSDTLFGDFDNAVGPMLTGDTFVGPSGSSEFQALAGQKMPLSVDVAALYNQSATTVSQATVNRLVTTSPVTQFARANGDPKVYLIDGGKKHYVSSASYITAWGGANVNIVSSGYLNLIPEDTGNPLSSYIGDVSGKYYLADGRAWSIPENLSSSYVGSSTPFTATTSLISLLPAGGTATNFIKSSNSPAVYLLDNGNKRHITSAATYQLWSGGANPTTVRDLALGQFSSGADITSNYVTNGTVNAAVDNGAYYTVSAAVANDWNYPAPTSIADTTLTSLNVGGALGNKVRSGGSYYLVKYGRSHLTFNPDLAAIWGVNTSGPSLSQAFINTVPADSPLTIFVRSTDSSDQRIFVADTGGKLYKLSSIQQVQNYGYMSGPMLQLSPADINAMTITDATNILQYNSSYAVLDLGGKRPFINAQTQSNWLTVSNQISVSDNLWNFIPTGSSIGSVIKATAPNVYGVESGQKRWIQSQGAYQVYVTQNGPYMSVSDQLAWLVPVGANIP